VKYNNVPTEIDGYRFDSKAEAKRYTELRFLERCKEIKHLTVHPRYPLKVNDTLICTYVGDFSYHHITGKYPDEFVIEDVKGVKTAAYRIKKKLFEAIHAGWKITEVKVK
jgi:hypothetical protein